MRFTVTVALLLSLFSTCPADPSTPVPLSIPDEASWLSYYSFRSSHPLLSRDALNGVLSEGHRLRLDAASAALSAKIVESPEDGFRSLDAMINAAAKDGLDARAAFASTLSSLRSKSLEGKPEIAKSLESLAERLDSIPSPSADSRSGYLAWLAMRCGAEGETPDAEYLKAFPDAPWDKGLLKFWGDLHYFARRFDKAIDLYLRSLTKGDPASADARYSPFFESEVRQRIGQCHLVCDRFDSAAVELERASALANPPESAVSRLLAAHGLIRAKSPDAALPLLQAAQRDAGGSGALLPDAIVNSLKVQEALAWRAKGDPKKALELLAGFEKNPDAAFLLPSDRKLSWFLLASGYRAAGEEEKAVEAMKRAEAEPPLSAAQKLDPMNERYETFVETSANFLSHVAFYMGDRWYLDRVVLKGLTNVPARPKVIVKGADANGSYFSGCQVEGEGLIPIDGDTFVVDIPGGSGVRQFQIKVTEPYSGETATGIIVCHFIGVQIQSVKCYGCETLLTHFEDKNFNGKRDAGERLSDGDKNPTTWDTVEDTNLVFTKFHWTDDGQRTPCLYWKDDKPGFSAVFRETGGEGVEADVVMQYSFEPSFTCSSGVVTLPSGMFYPGFDTQRTLAVSIGESATSGLTQNLGIKDEKFVWKWKARYGNLATVEFPCGVSEHRVYVSAAHLSDPYLCLVDHALNSLAKTPAGRSPLETLHAGLAGLYNNDDPAKPLVFSPMKEETALYGYATQMDADLKMTLGRFLDSGRGNSSAWCKAFEAMAQVIGYKTDVRTMEWSNKWAVSLSSTIEVLATVGGVGQGNLESALFNKWLGSFPGFPNEERGDIDRDKSERWMPLPDHSIVLVKEGSKFDLVDPSFSGQPWAFQAGLFSEEPYDMRVSSNPRFASDYFLKLAPSFRALGVPCHLKNTDDKIIRRLDLSTDSVLLIDRPFDITFHYGAKEGKRESGVQADHDRDRANEDGRHAVASDERVSGELSKKEEAVDEPRINDAADRRKKTSPPSSQELADLDKITDLADSGNPASYVAALTKCKEFLEKYPLSDYYTFIGYIFSRMLILGVANPGFEAHYHIPGWWYQDPAFIAFKNLLFSGTNQAHIAWQEKHAVDTALFDGVADASLMLGRYAQMAGEYELAAGYLAGAADPKYKNHAPFLMASLGETLSNHANEKPEKRGEAISWRAKYLTAYGDRPDLEALSVSVLYGMAADLLFAGRLDEAESVIKYYLDMVKDNPMTPGLKIMLAHVHAKKKKPDYAEAESLLRGVYNHPYSGPYATQSRAGFRPWAALVLTKTLVEKGDLSKAIDFASKHLAAESNSFTGDLAPYKFFYSSWTRMHNAGISTQLARAYTMTGDHVAALKELDRFAQSYGDEDRDNLSKVGLPFPRFVFPVWGDDTGDWGALANRLRSGQRVNRSLKARPVDFGNVKVRFVNPFREAEQFTRATVYYNTGRFDEAKEILDKLANPSQSGSRDHLSMPVVGADQFLIALSPPFSNRYQEQAKELLKKIPYLKVNKAKLISDLSEKDTSIIVSVVRGDGTPVDCKITVTSDSPAVATVEEAVPAKNGTEFKINLRSVGVYNLKIGAYLDLAEITKNVEGKIFESLISEINFIKHSNDDYIQLKEIVVKNIVDDKEILEDKLIQSPEYILDGTNFLINPVALVRGSTPKFSMKIKFIKIDGLLINKIRIKVFDNIYDLIIDKDNNTETLISDLPDLSNNKICNIFLSLPCEIVNIEGIYNGGDFNDRCSFKIKSAPIPVYYSWNKPLVNQVYKYIAHYASNWAEGFDSLSSEKNIVDNLYAGWTLKKPLQHEYNYSPIQLKSKDINDEYASIRQIITKNYGQCQAFSHYFKHLCSFHGISVKIIRLKVGERDSSTNPNSMEEYYEFLVSNNGIGNKTKIRFPNYDVYNVININDNVITYPFVNSTNIEYHKALPTNYSGPPVFQNDYWWFQNHVFCLLDDKWFYDASFDVSPFSFFYPGDQKTLIYDLKNINDPIVKYVRNNFTYLGGRFKIHSGESVHAQWDVYISMDKIISSIMPTNFNFYKFKIYFEELQ